MSRTKTFLPLLVMLCLPHQLFAQQGSTLSIDNPSVGKVDSMVRVEFEIVAGQFPRDHKSTFTPVLSNRERQYALLPTISLVGTRQNVVDQRAGFVFGNRHVVSKTDDAPIKYSARVPFEDWMQVVSVTVYESVVGCSFCTELASLEIISNRLLYYDLIPHYNRDMLKYEFTELEKFELENPFLHQMEDYPKRYEILMNEREQGTSSVVFKTGSDVLEMDNQHNQNILRAIGEIFELIKRTPGASLKHIVVAGYASPEGPLKLNTDLARRRAEAVKRFIQILPSHPDNSVFELYNGQEDWGGLREKVEKSDIANRNDIITVIDGYTMEQEIRKIKLKQVSGNESYKYMLDNFYPALRCAGYLQVYYEVSRQASVATVVNDDRGQEIWIDPNSTSNRCVTAVNKALPLLIDGQFDKALAAMLDFRDDPRTFNLIGVCYMMMRQYRDANLYLTNAVANGDPDAVKNLEQTRKYMEIEERQSAPNH